MQSKGNSLKLNYCRRCGEKLAHVRNHIFVCSNNHTIFANSTPTVGIFFVTQTNTILLSRRAIEPWKGWLDSVGGFLDGAETFEHAAEREIEEELGLSPKDFTSLSYLCSSTGTYIYQDETLSIVNVFFWTRLLTTATISPKDDVAETVEITFDTDIDALQMDEQIKVGLRHLLEKRRNHEL